MFPQETSYVPDHHPFLDHAQKYKYRLIVDESLSLGVLGKNGRGATEHFEIGPGEAEIIGASLGTRGRGFCTV